MLSPSKILLTVAVIVVVVMATRFLRRRSENKAAGRDSGAREAPAAEELEACAVCGDYVSTAAPACGRADCPKG